MKKYLSILLMGVFLISTADGQKKKPKIGVDGGPIAPVQTVEPEKIDENNDSAWTEVVDQKARFRVIFPGAAENGGYGKIGGPIITYYNVNNAKRAYYSVSWYSKTLKNTGRRSLNKLYDSITQDMLKDANSGPMAELTKAVSGLPLTSVEGGTEFVLENTTGREIMFGGIGETVHVRMIYFKGKVYLQKVIEHGNLPADDKEILKRTTKKFFGSFRMIKK